MPILNLPNSVSVLTVFVQGILSFFSPCVLPLIPLYVSYLAGGASTVDADGKRHYPRGKILVNTCCFVLGISFTFFLLGLGMRALGSFFQSHQILFARISGVIIFLFGLYQLGLGKRSMLLEQERRLPFRLDRLAMNPGVALLMGFTFSFAWTPCVGPALSSVLLMAGNMESSGLGFLLICIYTLGFVLPFLAVGLFTGAVLEFFQSHQNVVRYTVKIGAVLLILMGILTFTGITGNVSQKIPTDPPSEQQEEAASPAPDFTLTDQYGTVHTLSDYQGKTVFLNFWATWCPPCRRELGDIQALYESYGKNQEDLVVLGVAAPNANGEQSQEEIAAFLEENGCTYPVVMNEGGSLFHTYGISAFPTTFMIDREGRVFGYVQGGLSAEMMEDIVQQTLTGQRR